MGEVFFAWAYGVARTRKPVVVKVLRAEMLAEPGAPEMFVEEGRLSLSLSHSNVLQVFDFGKADERFFMAMEYVDGFHLGELRRKAGGRLAIDLALFVAMEVCLGLDYAHRLRNDEGVPLHIVHRDVTPSNVLVSREGEVKLADFGIARAVGRSQHTQAGQIRGKVRYMSPEAARGETLDRRSDLFSLGAILFELLTGRRAFDATGGREAILKQIVSGRAPAPSSTGQAMHAAVDEVVLKALAPTPDERFHDAFAMHRALEEAAREAGLFPSRGKFMEFLREIAPEPHASLDSSSGSSGIRERPRGSVTESGKPQPDLPSTAEASSRPTPDTRSGAPIWPSAADLPAGATMSVEAKAPTAERSRSSASSGAVPPADPYRSEGSALPTGVASPVLFTLTVAGQDPIPEAGGFEVTNFEVERPSADAPSRDSVALFARTSPSGAPPSFAETVVSVPPPERETQSRIFVPPAAGSLETVVSARDPSAAAGEWRLRTAYEEAPGAASEPDFPAIPDRVSRVPKAWFAAGSILVAVFAVAIGIAASGGLRRADISSNTPPPTPFAMESSSMQAPVDEPTPDTIPTRVADVPAPDPTRTSARTPRPVTSRAVAAPTRTPAPAFGVVDLNSDPWSEVRIAGTLLGTTPVLGVRLPVGRHVLSFRNPRSGVVKNVEIDVRSGKNRPVLVELRR